MDDGLEFLRQPSLFKKSALEAEQKGRKVHFCSCNKEFIPESIFWVSSKIYNFGKEFIVERKG